LGLKGSSNKYGKSAGSAAILEKEKKIKIKSFWDAVRLL
jgi:hypothetical protein